MKLTEEMITTKSEKLVYQGSQHLRICYYFSPAQQGGHQSSHGDQT